MRFRLLFPTLCLLAGSLSARTQPTPAIEPSRYATAEIAPSKTSIYLGSVALVVPPLARSGSFYASTYSATVFPFFFFNERGSFRIQVPDADMDRLTGGHPIDFAGNAVRDDGASRLVQGHATPHGPTGGDLKIRVYYSRLIVLVFNTTYRLSVPAR